MGIELSFAVRQISFESGVGRQGIDLAVGNRASRRPLAKGAVHSLIDADNPVSEESLRDAAASIARAYHDDPTRSVTSSLIRALQAANDQFRLSNQRLGRADRFLASAACAVLRGDDVYVGRVGNAVGYLVRDGLADRVTPLDPRGGPRLGSESDLDVDLYHRTLAPGDVLILASGSVADLAPDDLIAELADAPDVDGVIANLCALHAATPGAPDLRALVVRMDDGANGQPADRGHGLLKGRSEPQTSKPKVSRAQGSPKDLAAASAALDENGIPDSSDPGVQRCDNQLADNGMGEPPPVEDEALPGPLALESAERDLRLGDRLVSVLRPSLAAGRADRRTSRVAMIGMIVATVALAGFVVVYLPLRFWQDHQDGVSSASLLQRAEQQEHEALAAEDPAVQVRLLTDARDLAVRAARARRGDTFAQGAVARIGKELDRTVGAVRLIQPIQVLVTDGDLTQGVLVGDDLYLLDGDYGLRHYGLSADGRAVRPAANTLVLRVGDRIGGVLIGALSTALWAPAGSARAYGAVLAVDVNGRLFEVDPSSGARTLRLVDPQGWVEATALAGYAGSVYALDAGANALRWYPPSTGGYDLAAYPYLRPEVTPTLASAVDLGIVEGEVYVLDASGQMYRYGQGQPLGFDGTLPDQLTEKPLALALSQRSVFVLDPSNYRVVWLDRNGVFERQLLYDPTFDVRDLAVDEERGLLYLVTGRTVYAYPIGEAEP